MVVVGADEQLQTSRHNEQGVDANDSVANEARIVNVFVSRNDSKNKPANDHEQGNACVPFIYQADQGVATFKVPLGMVEKMKQHHQACRQKSQMVKPT